MAMVGVASGCLQAVYGQPTSIRTARVVWRGLRVGGYLAPFRLAVALAMMTAPETLSSL